MSNDQEIQEFLNDTLGDWSENSVRLLMESVRSNRIVLTEELLRSFQYQVIKASNDHVAAVKLAFNDYGRMREMKKLFYSRMPNIEAMEAFVRKIGVSNFNYVPGYKPGRIPSEEKAITRIAYGLGKARLDGLGKYKPQKWFNKVFYREINILINKLLEGYQKQSIKAVKDSLS